MWSQYDFPISTSAFGVALLQLLVLQLNQEHTHQSHLEKPNNQCQGTGRFIRVCHSEAMLPQVIQGNPWQPIREHLIRRT